MSWDVSLTVDVDGSPIDFGECFYYTHNTNPMIREAGFREWPYEVDGMLCRHFCDRLDGTLRVLRSDPERFRAMNPENDWGDYDSLLTVLADLLDTFDRFPSATVRMWA